MKALRRLFVRLWNSVTKRRSDFALREEFETHVAMQTEDNLRQGMSAEEARRAARIKFGSFEAARESYRDQQGLPVFEQSIQDLRYAWRGMRRSPGFSAIAVLSLGVGIGSVTAIFSVVNGVLLEPLAYQEPDRLFAIREEIVKAGQGSMAANPLHIREWRRQCPSLESVAGARLAGFNLLVGNEAENIQGALVDPELFETLGVQPQAGRVFLADEAEPGRNKVVLISDALWRRRFAADPTMVGKTIILSGLRYQVVGVLPSYLRFPFSGGMEPYSNLQREPEIYQPLVIESTELQPLTNFNYGAIARLKPGATPEAALAEINTVQAQFPRLAGEDVILKAKLIPLEDLFVGKVRLALWVLLGAVGAVLLIVCVNLANLLVARMTARTRESAIRAALGASRGRQIRQILTESMLLSLAGGALGILVALAGIHLLRMAGPADLPRLDQVRLDAQVLAFAVCISLATGLLAGLLPGYMRACKDPHEALKSGSQTATAGTVSLRTRHVLIGVEVALATALLIVSGLLTTSFIHVLNIDKGFETQRVLTADIPLMSTKYADREERERFFQRLLTRLRTTPGVLSAALVTRLPSRGEAWIDPVSVEGDTRRGFEQPMPNNRTISPDYFRAMGIRILSGRSFEEGDRNRDVGILSQKLAEQLWPGKDPIGRRFISDGKPRTVVGVVADVRTTLTEEPVMIVYYPYWSRPPSSVSLVIRSTGDPVAFAPLVRAAIRDEDPQVPVQQMKTLEQMVDASIEQRRFQLVVVLLFAGSALLVASLGIYGVVSFAVTRRRTELSVRAALGARPGHLLLLVARQGMTPVLIGLVVGTSLALGIGSIIRGVLFAVEPNDPAVITIVLALLFATALTACLLPARRAVRCDPARTLRFE